MEIHRQHCQNCQSVQMQNILVREPGRSPVVYSRCDQCEQLVACYTLEDYYHHGKGIESYLRSHGGTSAESGRGIMRDFKDAEERAVAGFEAAVEHLRRDGKDV